jgi:hypothetical protein
MVVNRKLASNSVHSSCGTGGVVATVDVSLPSQPAAVDLQQIDKTNVNCSTNTAGAPVTQTLTPAQSISVSFPGYGLAVLSVK